MDLKFDVKKQKTKIIFYVMYVVTLIYIFWRLLFTLPLKFGYFSLFIGIILLAIEIWDTIDFSVHFFNTLITKKIDIKLYNGKKIKYPDIDILIATYNEDISILEKTINGCQNLKYPDKSKLHIYICDDGNRKEVEKLCKKMKINYISRCQRTDAKAGNYNNALTKIKSPYVATLDADMIPMDDFIIVAIKYFFKSEDTIGFVQFPQSFYNPDIYQSRFNLSKRIPFEQQFFYQELQIAKNTINASLYCGTNTLFLRKALDDVNGFATGTLSEDIATGMLIENKGYKCIAVDDIKVSGYSVDDLSGFLRQRSRWARGCIQMLRKYKIFSCKGLNVRQKLEYFSCVSYWFFGLKRLIYLIIPILFASYGVVIINCDVKIFLLFWLPMYILKRFALDILYNNKRSATLNKIYETILAPILSIQVLMELVGIRKTKFEVSPKNKNNSSSKNKKDRMILIISHSVLLSINIVAFITCLQNILKTDIGIYYISIIWLISNIFYLTVAIIFDIGKKEKWLDSFGVYASCKCVLKKENIEIHVKTKRISEDKFLIVSNNKLDINDIFDVTIYESQYESKFTSDIEQEISKYDNYEYILKIKNIDRKNRLLLYQIMYNRRPPKVDFYSKKSIIEIFLKYS